VPVGDELGLGLGAIGEGGQELLEVLSEQGIGHGGILSRSGRRLLESPDACCGYSDTGVPLCRCAGACVRGFLGRILLLSQAFPGSDFLGILEIPFGLEEETQERGSVE
jgi:hypothetical protein